ncbi:ProQ/FINO family protein [Stenoxybacter acetivorans]|uniref:ProQ/FINO family protein n=1 Tax=Stenoxybacter acetivorans TaxID=422441 RepID=UPI000A040C4C|nr:ProQ/FINO family protein [Stenoxybacter acetivorans]
MEQQQTSEQQTLSKNQQLAQIKAYLYHQFEVLKEFKPLALGIDKDIIAALPQFDKTLVKRALSSHCRHPRYINNLAQGGKRYDLQGNEQGEVTPEQQAKTEHHQVLKIQAVIEYLNREYTVFKQLKPLSNNILNELTAALPQYDTALLRTVLRRHVFRTRYLKAVIRGGDRLNLLGEVCGKVSAGEQKAAQQQLAHLADKKQGLNYE